MGQNAKAEGHKMEKLLGTSDPPQALTNLLHPLGKGSGREGEHLLSLRWRGHL